MNEPIIRRARPEDVAAAVPLIYSSGPSAFDYVFSHRTRTTAQDFLAHAFTCAGGGFGYAIHWVVELDGAVVGTAAGYTGSDARRFMLPAIGQIFHCYGLWGSWPVLGRGLRIEQIIVPPRGPGYYYIANVGIAPELRGRGLGQWLLEHLHTEARERGATTLALDVSVENPRAEALYRRMGYEEVREVRSNLRNDTGYVANHRRMERGVGNSE
jgi:ribosomal protein S18 acetylase RimI-like enzyme